MFLKLQMSIPVVWKVEGLTFLLLQNYDFLKYSWMEIADITGELNLRRH